MKRKIYSWEQNNPEETISPWLTKKKTVDNAEILSKCKVDVQGIWHKIKYVSSSFLKRMEDQLPLENMNKIK